MNKTSTRVGYLGPDTSTFGYQALQKVFTSESEICRERPKPISFATHQAICQAVGNLEIKYGVVAIENVIDGVVAETVRSIASVHAHLGIAICGETTIPIELLYMSKLGKNHQPKRLISHQTALGQCREFVASLQNRGISIEVRSSTGQAAQEAARDPESAALASRAALTTYELQAIIPESVVDHPNSVTRFWILAKQHARRIEGKARYKTCFLVNLEQSASGVLHKTLGVFAKHGISVLLVYPSPILGKKWEYTFLIEVSGYVMDKGMDTAWHDFQSLGISLQPMQFLGSYPDNTSGQ